MSSIAAAAAADAAPDARLTLHLVAAACDSLRSARRCAADGDEGGAALYRDLARNRARAAARRRQAGVVGRRAGATPCPLHTDDAPGRPA